MTPEVPDPLVSRAPFRFGDWLVQPSQNAISRGEAVVHLRPKVMDVLNFLAQHDAEVVPNEALLSAVWGKRFLARSALAGAMCELREALGDEPQHPRFIETVAKRGYRLVAPVRWDVAERVADASGSDPRRLSRRRLVMVGAVAAMLLLVVGIATRRLASPTRSAPRIVVLPFENLGHPEANYLSAGIADEVTTRLAGVRGLVVISSATARQYGGTAKSLDAIGSELRVAYALQGSVRWDGSAPDRARVRITSRLIRIKDGEVLWAGAWDGLASEVLAIQGEIGRSVVKGLDIVALPQERDRLERPPTANVDAYQAYLRGRQYMRDIETADGAIMAVKSLERAVELDPAFVSGHTALAHAHGMAYHFGYDRSATRRKAAEGALQRARALSPNDVEVLWTRAYFSYIFDHDYPAALAALAEVRERRPGTAENFHFEGVILRRQGHFDEALDRLRRAAELNPRSWRLAFEIATTESALGLYSGADRDYRRSLELAPDQLSAYWGRAENTLQWKGSVAEARAVMAQIPALQRSSVAAGWIALDLYSRDYDAALGRLNGVSDTDLDGQSGIAVRSLLESDILLLKGETVRARAAADAARGALEARVAADPADWRTHSALALAYAGLGRSGDAVREATRGVELCPASLDALVAPVPVATLARVQVMTGDLDAAVTTLGRLASAPPGAMPLLDLDPWWDPLRQHPQFRALLARQLRLRQQEAS